MKFSKRFRPYEERFLSFSNFAEKIIIRLLIYCIIGLILSQVLLSFTEIRSWLVPVERIEGTTSFFGIP